jgi:hypothetical protein
MRLGKGAYLCDHDPLVVVLSISNGQYFVNYTRKWIYDLEDLS